MGPDPPRHDHSRGKGGRTLPRASAASRTFANTATIHTMTTAADPVFPLAASGCLPETRVRGFNFEKQTCTGASAWLTSTSRWVCGYRCDGTASVSLVQRYYASTYGRFNTPDPYQASAGRGDPGSWNRYSYTRGDPVNRVDPGGTCDLMIVAWIPDAGPLTSCDASLGVNINPAAMAQCFAVNTCLANFQAMQGGGFLVPNYSNAFSQAGIANAQSALRQLSKANLAPCAGVINSISSIAPNPFSMAGVQAEAGVDANYVYDGASSKVAWDPTHFGAGTTGVMTIGQGFSGPWGLMQLSQGDGHAIFVRSATWGSSSATTVGFGLITALPALDSASGPTNYALASMLHEVLHKFGLGDGELETALGVSPGDVLAYGSQTITNALFKDCFK